jgi:hypothetical protein
MLSLSSFKIPSNKWECRDSNPNLWLKIAREAAIPSHSPDDIKK